MLKLLLSVLAGRPVASPFLQLSDLMLDGDHRGLSLVEFSLGTARALALFLKLAVQFGDPGFDPPAVAHEGAWRDPEQLRPRYLLRDLQYANNGPRPG